MIIAVVLKGAMAVCGQYPAVNLRGRDEENETWKPLRTQK